MTKRHKPGFISVAVLTVAMFAVAALRPARADNTTEKRIVTTAIADAPAYAKYALVIGVTDYDTCGRLHDCNRDAKDFAGMLRSKFGFASVVVMTDDPGGDPTMRPTERHIKNALKTMYDGVIPGKSEVVVYFSGHGTRARDAGGADTDWLVPEDGDPDDIPGTCVNYDAIRQRLDTLGPHRVLLITDACRDLLGNKGVGENEFGKGLHLGALGSEVAELQSCQARQTSLEGDPEDFDESVFTHFLIRGLSGDPDAVDPDKHAVTFDSLKEYVQYSVHAYAAQHNREQTPDGRASLGSMILARLTPDVISPAPIVPSPRRQAGSVAADVSLILLWTDSSGRLDRDKAKSMSVDDVRNALAAGANVDARDAYSQDTTLMAAVIAGRMDIVKLLLDAGADVHAKEDGSTTLIYLAADSGNAYVVKLLLDAGAAADVNVETSDGRTPLMRAAEYDRADIVSALLAAGAATDPVDEHFGRMTALRWAINKYGYAGVVKPLLDAGAAPDAASLNWCLISAAAHGKADVVKLVLDRGADKDATDQDGHSALWWANNPSTRDFTVAADHVAATIAVLQEAGAKE